MTDINRALEEHNDAYSMKISSNMGIGEPKAGIKRRT
jgi:hypothetical protein